MGSSINLAGGGMLAVSRTALSALRTAMLRDGGPETAGVLREAGYAGGEAVWSSFVGWLASNGHHDPADLSLEELEARASEYFSDAGWGALSIGTLGTQDGAVMTVDSVDWGEADATSHLDGPACHFTTGMLADFFGRLSDEPLAVLEVECRSTGADRCRFLLGNGDVMTYVFEEMDRGENYAEAVARVE
ncbi:MAG: V4R domain-containing protein [Gemmatimonadaceae bacterium]